MPPSTDQIWTEFAERLRHFIRRRVRDEQDAEDILQEVFVKIHRKIDSLNDATKLTAWVHQIARNALIDHYRGRVSRDVPFGRLREEIVRSSAESDVSREIASCLKPMIDRLPPTYRDAVVLTELDSLSRAALAKQFRLSLSGAKSRVQRGRERLKTMLLECCHFEFDRRGKIIAYDTRGRGCPSCARETPRK